jgi:alkanesulfonate monooxygenase SsuD/methylene tetrahydromethanopterin reductase-like flavin-dependent oxidoreductase (luciferase family)
VGARFGCLLDPEGCTWAALRDHVLEAEALGFARAWMPDHLVAFRDDPFLEAWTTVAALAAVTSTIRVGTLVSNITYRNPALLAREALTVDQISGGRLDVGIGAGGRYERDAAVAGVEHWAPGERVDRFEDFCRLVAEVLSGAEDHDGPYYSTAGWKRGSWPVQRPRPPLTLAGQSPRALRVVGRLADRWSGLADRRYGDDVEGHLSRCNEAIDEAASEAGRDPRSIVRSVLLQNVGDAFTRSLEAMRDLVGRYGELGITDIDVYWECPPDPGFRDVLATVLEEAT